MTSTAGTLSLVRCDMGSAPTDDNVAAYVSDGDDVCVDGTTWAFVDEVTVTCTGAAGCP